MTSVDEIVARVRAELPDHIAVAWSALLLPAVGLTADDSGGGPVAGQLGGPPALPVEMWWPEWDGVCPLSFIASLDCAVVSAALATAGANLALPTSGTLLFFCADGQVDPEWFVSLEFPSSQAGSRIVYVPAGTPTRERAAPEPLQPSPALPLWARPRLTAIGQDNPLWRAVVADLPDADRAAVRQVLWKVEEQLADRGEPHHQVGGYPTVIQGDVLAAVAGTKLGRLAADSPMWSVEVSRWLMLLQVDTDHRTEMSWGDLGIAHWFIRQEDLAVGDFGEALMSWECH
jgi:uncharacterized protein YwqG